MRGTCITSGKPLGLILSGKGEMEDKTLSGKGYGKEESICTRTERKEETTWHLSVWHNFQAEDLVGVGLPPGAW